MTEPDPPFVETVRIQNFGCARDLTLELSRLHALIGPNDSGKSTVLHAIRIMGQLVAGAGSQSERRFENQTAIAMRWHGKQRSGPTGP